MYNIIVHLHAYVNAMLCSNDCFTLIGSDGAAVKELLTTVMTNTPHMWSQHTLQCFPPVLVEFFAQVQSMPSIL